MAYYTYDQNGRAYRLKGGKHSCPYCGQRTLQLYIAVDDGNPISLVHTTPTTRRSCHPTRTASEDMCQKRSKR